MGFLKIEQQNGDGTIIINAARIVTIKVPANGNYVDFITYLGEDAGRYGQLRAMAKSPGSLGADTQERFNDYVIQALTSDVVVCVPFAGQEISNIIIEPAP